MEFSIELYETPDGRPVVEEELEAIENSVPVLHDLLITGMNKLRRREYHRPPLCDALGGGLFELRVGHKDIARAAWFFQAGQHIIVVRCFVKKSQKMPRAELDLAHKRMSEYLSRRRAGGA